MLRRGCCLEGEWSDGVLLEAFHILVDALEFGGDVDALGAVGRALAAADAVACLAQFRDTPVVANQEGATGLPVIGIAAALRQIVVVDALVVVHQDRRDVDAVGTRHAVLAVVAGDGVHGYHLLRHFLQEPQLVSRQRLKRSETSQIVLQMLHLGHAAQDGMDVGVGSAETERPRRHATFRLPLLHSGHDGVRHSCQTATQQRLHNHCRDVAPGKFVVQILRVGVARIGLLGVFPVQIVHLYLDEVPLVLVMTGQ